MGMNALQNLESSLVDGSNEVLIDEKLRQKALLPLERMVAFQSSERILIRN
jgi:quinolinate synthase